jgi:hypothetical protein
MLSDSELFIIDYPTLSIQEAIGILKNHGFDDASLGDRDDLGVSFDPEGYEHIMYLCDDGEIDTAELFAWLGY